MSLQKRMADLVPVAPHSTTPAERVAAGLRPTGEELFAAKTKEEQDAAVGPDAADLIRNGEADLKDFISHSPTQHGPDFITQRPVGDVVT